MTSLERLFLFEGYVFHFPYAGYQKKYSDSGSCNHDAFGFWRSRASCPCFGGFADLLPTVFFFPLGNVSILSLAL